MQLGGHQAAPEEHQLQMEEPGAGLALPSRGGEAASGSTVPGGQVAADSHKWYLDGGGRNKRGAWPCLPETGSSLISAAAIFHHPASPRCGNRQALTDPSHPRNALGPCCPPTPHSRKGSSHEADSTSREKIGGRRIHDCFLMHPGEKSTFDI